MLARWAYLASSGEEGATCVTGPTDSLLGLLQDQRLRSWSRTRSRQDDLLVPKAPVRVGLNGRDRVRRDVLLLARRSLLLLLLRLPGRVARARLAPDVLALDTDFVSLEAGAALVAVPVDAHANRFLDAIRLSIRAVRQGLDGDGEALSHPPHPVGLNLRTHHLRGLWQAVDGGFLGFLGHPLVDNES